MLRQRFFNLSLVLACGLVLSSVGPGNSEQGDASVSIVSDRMVAKNRDGLIIFEGNVVLTKQEFRLTADRLEVTMTPSQPGDQRGEGMLTGMPAQENSISLIEAIGRVTVRQGNREGRSDHAVYDQRNEKVILTGNPEVWDNDYRVSGKKMIFFIKEQKSVVEDSKAILYPR